MHTFQFIAAGLGVLAATAATVSEAADAAVPSFPIRPIRLIVPYPPGGGSDVVARIVAPRLGEALGQQIVIDNRGGAATIIGMDLLAKSAPDGYTFGIATSTLTVNASLYKKLPFDVARDFAPVILAADGLYVLVVHPSVPVKSVGDLVALARSGSSRLNGAMAGAGTPMHLGLVQFNTMTGAQVGIVAYKGAGPAMTSLLAGETQMAIISMPTVVGHVQSGKLRALAVTTERRNAAAPGLPTASESGLPGFVQGGWYGFFAPAATPVARVARLNEGLRQALMDAEVKKRFVDFGADIIASSAPEFDKFFRAELAKWGKVVREAKLSVD
jgi:tripartite-type tricarboxylate transporter receptor subunit TctC